eukprot:4920746-Pyramimonas_sp.AAC.1
MGHGSEQEQVFVCGDASGGKDTGSNKLRRVGLAIVRMLSKDRSLAHSCVAGPLTGSRQVVARGELKAFQMALYCTSGALTYVTDCDMVAEG